MPGSPTCHIMYFRGRSHLLRISWIPGIILYRVPQLDLKRFCLHEASDYAGFQKQASMFLATTAECHRFRGVKGFGEIQAGLARVCPGTPRRGLGSV